MVRQIPQSKVTTYGLIAERLGIGARIVGWALHVNHDLKVPCHRVVDRNGKIAKNYAFEGGKKQKELLLKEGVKFKDQLSVDLEKCLWKPKESIS